MNIYNITTEDGEDYHVVASTHGWAEMVFLSKTYKGNFSGTSRVITSIELAGEVFAMQEKGSEE